MTNSNSENTSEDKFQYEKDIIEFWDKNKIFDKVLKKNEPGKEFNFVEGPAYPTGDAHLGHLRNWSIKDSVLRYKRFQGMNVYARDGYDVHGLPVENKVQAKLNLKTVDGLKEFGIKNFIKECKNYSNEIINEMKEVKKRYGVWMNPDNYNTSNVDYMSMAWTFFKKAHEKDLLYKDYKTVAWCPHDETTLSDYEIKDTYKTLDDPSIYVKFPIRKEDNTTEYNEFLVIWTTTPWTLGSNMAIAMHPEFDYAKALVEINGKEEVLVIAESLVDSLINHLESKKVDIKLKKVLEVKKGIEYEGTKYEHIFLNEVQSQADFLKLDHKFVHSVVMADYVTLGEAENIIDKLAKKSSKHSIGEKLEKVEVKETKGTFQDGTGLVHIAPGHGFDDYDVGKKYNLPTFCPVDKKGILKEGICKGKYFKDADPEIIENLQKRNLMLYSSSKSHRYPCCWRCKTPIVYRATDQWWIKRSQVTPDIIEENSKVNWYPSSARDNFNNLMSGAGDWAISRQRFWGIPLPVWEDEDGNFEVIGSREELEERTGKKLDDLHIDSIDKLEFKSKGGKTMKRTPLTVDVWFDSGCASFASHYGEGLSFDEIVEKYYPMDWITEGEDQMRGWFSSLFNVGYVTNEKRPYKNLLFYSFVMDKNGVKMSKSLGNGISGADSIKNWGTDRTRYYLLTKAAPELKLNFDPDEFQIVNGFFNTLENVFKFANIYLKENKTKNSEVNLTNIEITDLWILSKLNETIFNFEKLMSNYKLNLAFKEVENFLVNDFSKVYLKLAKERTEERDDDLIVILSEILKKSLVMLSCAIPFKAEELYQELNVELKKESIFLENFPEVDQMILKKAREINLSENFELSQNIINGILNSREKAKIGVRWPLAQVDIGSSINLSETLKPFEPLIKKLSNIMKINYDLGDVEFNYIIKPNFKELKTSFDNPSEAISTINKNKFYIANDLKSGLSEAEYDGVKINFERHIIKEMELKDNLISSDFSKGNVILHTEQDEILLEEGYLRELMRRVQSMRKDLGLSKDERISLSFEGSSDYYIELIKNTENIIKKKVGAEDILQKELDNKKEFQIKDEKLVISIS